MRLNKLFTFTWAQILYSSTRTYLLSHFENPKALKPLLNSLREHRINYCWRFPLSLQASCNCDDLSEFCNLHISCKALPELYQEFQISASAGSSHTSPHSSLTIPPPKRRYNIQRENTENHQFTSLGTSPNKSNDPQDKWLRFSIIDSHIYWISIIFMLKLFCFLFQ